jgi:hypothetical protein
VGVGGKEGVEGEWGLEKKGLRTHSKSQGNIHQQIEMETRCSEITQGSF